MRNIIIASLFILSLPVSASTLVGTLVFEKKAPYAGVIFAEGGKGPAAVELDQKNKVFDKKLLVVGSGGELTFNNSDDFQHNIFANDPNSGVKFDVGLMEQGQQKQITANWAENTVTRIGCKIHPKMRSYIANINSDTYQILPFEKKVTSYDIKVEAGNHKRFTLAMPKYDPVVVTLAPGESKTVDVLRKGKKKATLTLTLN